MSLRDDKLGFAAVSGPMTREAQSLVRDGLAETAEIEPVLQLELPKTVEDHPAAGQSDQQPDRSDRRVPVLGHSRSVEHDRGACRRRAAAGKLGSSSTLGRHPGSGLDYTHPDLAGHVDLARSVDFVDEADSVLKYIGPGRHPITDLHSHGTHVGTVVSSNALISAGITSMTTLVGVKVCNMRAMCPTAAVFAGIRYAADAGVSVINLSLGGTFSKSDGKGFNAVINRAFNYAKQKGVLIVVSAGNSASDLDHNGNAFAAYCDAPHVVCVSASAPPARARSDRS